MFLTKAPRTCGLWTLLLWMIPSAVAGTDQTTCQVFLDARGPTGDTVVFEVQEVSVRGSSLNLLFATGERAVRRSGSTLLFSSRRALSLVFTIKVRSGGSESHHDIFLTQCPQRVGLRIGAESSGYGDVAYAELSGFLSGCRFGTDWWVRAAPMFGAVTRPWLAEGTVETSGVMKLSGDLHGERVLIVIGRGSSPIHVVAFNVTVGRRHDLGKIDLAGKCP